MTRKYYLLGALLVAAALLATLVAYPRLPEVVPTHWGWKGQVNGYSPKWALLVTGPGLMGAVVLLFRVLPWLSPRRWEVDSFRSTYLYIMVVILGLLAACQALVLWVGLGHRLDVRRAVAGAMCVLFALLGNVLGKVRRNFYIGVRTPWSLASERVWNATHRVAAKTFVLSALIGLALTALGVDSRLILGLLLGGVLVPVVYSLALYKQLERSGQL